MRVLILITLAALTGCAGYGAQIQEYAETGAERAAKAADFSLEAGIWSACTKPTIGSVRRAYPTDEQVTAYLDACDVLTSKKP